MKIIFSKNVLEEYAGILKKYMRKFGLESVDIAYLIKSTKKNIDALLSNSGNLKLDTLEEIAQLFSLRYYEFGNPSNPLPSLKSLPERTRARIEFRKKEGQPEETTYQQRNLNEKILVILSKYKVNDEFLVKTVLDDLNMRFPESINGSNLNDRFSKSMKEYVIKTERKDITVSGRGGTPHFYRLIKEISKSELNKALKSIENRTLEDRK